MINDGPQKTVVLDVVGLSRNLISAEHTPFLHGYMAQSDVLDRDVEPVFPALTCPAQSTYVSGTGPSTHGITANGFYDRSYCEVKNWHQSSKLVRTPRIWDALKANHPEATVFVNGLWHGMHDPALDLFINVRPQYLQNGGKVADVYTHPAGLREELQGSLGTFPLHRFWGPGTGIESSKWIAAATVAVDKEHDPTLTMVYLPHLDYGLQKYGPPNCSGGGGGGGSSGTGKGGGKADDSEGPKSVLKDLREIDEVLRGLVGYYESEAAVPARVVILSEYAITPVEKPVYLNRALREEGLVRVRTENGGETLDCGECRAFALCDHQVAHVHVRHPTDIPLVRRVLENTPGVEKVMDGAELDAYYRSRADGTGAPGRRAASSRGAHHAERSGELVAVSDSSSWFAYYYWNDDAQAPDFARCVAIHRKPGYDPAEMFFRYPGFLGFAYLLLKLLLTYGLKLRTIVDATPLRCDMIRGSHGRLPEGDGDPRPLLFFREKKASPVSAAAGAAATGGGEEMDADYALAARAAAAAARAAAKAAAVAAGRAAARATAAAKEKASAVAAAAGMGAGEHHGAEVLGRESCVEKGRVVVAEDVYEVLWRILNGEI